MATYLTPVAIDKSYGEFLANAESELSNLRLSQSQISSVIGSTKAQLSNSVDLAYVVRLGTQVPEARQVLPCS